MMLSEKYELINKGTIFFDCPNCNALRVESDLIVEKRTPACFGISIGSDYKNNINCGECKTDFVLKSEGVNDLLKLKPDEIKEIAKVDISGFQMFLLLMLIPCCFAPIVGPIIYAYLFGNRRNYKGFWKYIYYGGILPAIYSSSMILYYGFFNHK